MIINNRTVEVLNSDGRTTYRYSAFSHSCKDAKEFFDGLFSSLVEAPSDYKYKVDDIFGSIMAEGWYVSQMYSDQWSVVRLTHELTKDSIVVQCDLIEHGLAAALRIIYLLAENKGA